MKLKVFSFATYWFYPINEDNYTQEQFDYVYKYLDFEKLDKNEWISFNNNETRLWFYKIYIESDLLKNIYNNSFLGYEYLKNNWGKGDFNLTVYYSDKQKLKTIVNKVINIELKRKNNNEN